jgi:hypothetical protein
MSERSLALPQTFRITGMIDVWRCVCLVVGGAKIVSGVANYVFDATAVTAGDYVRYARAKACGFAGYVVKAVRR